jgi:hypothetical protein
MIYHGPMTKAFSFALLLALIVACSGSTVGSPSPQDACRDYANVYCTRVNDCAPTFLQVAYGDVATCTSRTQINCPLVFQAPGTGLTTDIVERCIGAIPQVACGDLLGGNLPSDCTPVAGTLPNGGTCGNDDQCTGKYCNLGSNQLCGACSTKAAAGATCNKSGDCSQGLTCANGTCVAYAAAGAPCSTKQPCNPTLYCNGTTCGTPGGAGASCNGGSDLLNAGCDGLHGYYCNPTTKKCQQLGTATAGQPCGFVNGIQDGSLTICTGGATCFGLTALNPKTTCTPPAADGASCDATKGSNCLGPALCVSGLCKLKDPTACR